MNLDVNGHNAPSVAGFSVISVVDCIHFVAEFGIASSPAVVQAVFNLDS